MDELEVVELIQESPKFLQAGASSLLERFRFKR
jgi:thiopurine S-methyltransferase